MKKASFHSSLIATFLRASILHTIKPFRWLQRNGFTIKYDTTCYPYDAPATSSSISRKAGRPYKSATASATGVQSH